MRRLDYLILIPIILLLLLPSPSGALPGGEKRSTAGHHTFSQLKGPFNSGPEVTQACLSCHTYAGEQVRSSQHWRWLYHNDATGQTLGKRNVINNYCIAAMPNIATCSLCHVGYGWNDDRFDFSQDNNVDCLVCHEQTGKYMRQELLSPQKRRPKLEKFAQSVGLTSRRNCGVCHFSGGGGKAVKHGDIDPSLIHADFFVDVHMEGDGLNFSCATCHTFDQHRPGGSRYQATVDQVQSAVIPGQKKTTTRVSCRNCHGGKPHKTDRLLNQHTSKLACQTCHIPEFSRGDYATKTWWDWSTAGQLGADGQPISKVDQQGYEIYNSKKGDFRWEKHVTPSYRWFNGTITYTLLGEKIDPTGIVSINRLHGTGDDSASRIWPFKIMRGKQPYDTVYNTLLAPATSGEKGYWKTFDWTDAITRGMKAVKQPFSGQHGFVETEMFWPINHMVAPSEETVACGDCHQQGGRLDEIDGIYIPGRDQLSWVEIPGRGFVLLMLALVGIHLLARLILRRKAGGVDVISQPKEKVYLFKRFERFWHWSQAVLIGLLIATGFEIHGALFGLGFENAVNWHTGSAFSLLVLWIFAIFWHLTTGEWRHYQPSFKRLNSILTYYLKDFFQAKPHPFRPSTQFKHNPLQRLAYFGFKIFLSPLLWITGLLYYFYGAWMGGALAAWINLEQVAGLHTLMAYFLVGFLIVHLYMITTGHTLWNQTKAMITGWHDLEGEDKLKEQDK
ncbi:tetrathionate reductase family octaheme c-type cytochrome [Magnetococcales bacterium HHB-1]